MAFSSPQSGSSRRSTPTTLAEINVTPLVDVMLVLLIVFMISAPMMNQGIQVDLPKASASTLNDVPDQIILVVHRNKKIMMNEHELPSGTLRTRLEAISSVKPNVDVLIQADQAVPYGFIAQVMAEVKKAKINRVGLVTDPGEPGQRL